jgi:hypothetical protein
VVSIDEHRWAGPAGPSPNRCQFPYDFSTPRMWTTRAAKGRAERVFFEARITLPIPGFHTCGEPCGTRGNPCKTALSVTSLGRRTGHCRGRGTLLCSALAVVEEELGPAGWSNRSS